MTATRRNEIATRSPAGAPPLAAAGAPRPSTDELRPEAEVAFLPDAATFKTLAAHPLLGGPAKLRWGNQRSLYYDTEAADLHRSGLTLRMRRARGRNVMSLEMRDGLDAVEVTAAGEAPQIELFPPAARGLIAHATARRSIKPCFVSQIRRATRLLAYEGAMIQVAFDEGEIVAEARKAPLREIVLALKEGDAVSLYRLGLALTHIAPLRLGVVGRFDLGLALATGGPGGAVRAQAPDFDAAATLDAAIGLLLRQSLAHFLSNWPALDSTDSGEAVHQIRVALRRLRSLLGVLKRSFPSAELDALRAEAKRIADAFGDARDWAVFSAMIQAGPSPRLPKVSGLSALIALADARAEAGRAEGAAVLGAAATARFALALQVYVSAHGWRNAAAEAELRALGEPAIGFAARALERSFRQLKKRARGFETLAPEARHDMRIALKQMRYAVDFFGPLFAPVSVVEAFADRAGELQDLLGLANDASVAAHLIETVDVDSDPDLAFAAGAVVGWCERGGLIDEGALRGAWKALRKAERFWRDELPRAEADEKSGD